MTNRSSVSLVTLSLIFLLASTTLASVKTEQKTIITFAGMLGRMMGMFGGDAAKDGVVTTTVVVDDRMYTSSNDRTGQIVDLNERRIYDLDLRDKTFEVTTFDELRARIEEM